jgi:acyl-CoA thioesterase-2
VSGVQPTATDVPAEPASVPTATPWPHLARAWWGDELLAESERAVRVDEPGRAPALFFPCDDVRFEMLREGGRDASPAIGEVRLWDADGPSPDQPGRDDWWQASAVGAGGAGILRQYTTPPEALAWLAELATFDHDRVRVELVEGPEQDDPRDVTVTRFPTWGDAADLIALLDVQPEGDSGGRDDGRHGYVGMAFPDPRRPVVEGSQMLAQAMVAAGRHSPGRRVVSAHMVFARVADAGRPLRFVLDELSAGRTFTALAVQVHQGNRRCAGGTLLLGVPAAAVVRHAVAAPDVAGPHEAVPYDMSMTGRDLRVVDGAYTDDPHAAVGPPVIDAWVRFRDVPDDPVLHAGLLTQFTGHMSIAAALRPHAGIGQRQAHRTMSTAINAIAISLHADVRADRWMLYRHHATLAADGMTHAECRVHDQAGALLASFTVDAMVRPVEHAVGNRRDDRTAL